MGIPPKLIKKNFNFRYGYRYNLGAIINPRQGNMRIFLMLNHGEHDALLPWPLEFNSTVTIIPPTGSTEHPILLDMEARSMKSPQPHVPVTYKYSLVLSLEKLCKFATRDTLYIRGVVEEAEVCSSSDSDEL